MLIVTNELSERHVVSGNMIVKELNEIGLQCMHRALLSTTLVTRVGKKSFYTHFAPPHPCAMFTKHFHLTQVCILLFSNIERGNGGVDTYAVGVMIIISCFWHFPTQFVQGCSSLHTFAGL